LAVRFAAHSGHELDTGGGHPSASGVEVIHAPAESDSSASPVAAVQNFVGGQLARVDSPAARTPPGSAT
jgi:hypothetical protein